MERPIKLAKDDKTAPEGEQLSLMRRAGDKGIAQIKKETDYTCRADETGVPLRRKTDLDRCRCLDDGDLVKVIQTQNREAYAELVARYQKRLFIYLYRLVGNREEVEDLLQNVFAKTYRSIGNFDTDRKFSSWIYRIAHNEAVNFLKRKSKKRFVSLEDMVTSKDKLEASDDGQEPVEAWMRKETKQEVDMALAKLPPKYRQVLEMRYFSEYTYESIAKILKKPVNTVGTLINRAKKKLLEVVREDKAEK
ncbi:MAG TPA: RNA polymerase sigma factor [Candidatus Moranbacteria bacterium]|nr:RNA polymerase sigma factor [Candidatus Moranbacteria bacterium]